MNESENIGKNLPEDGGVKNPAESYVEKNSADPERKIDIDAEEALIKENIRRQEEEKLQELRREISVSEQAEKIENVGGEEEKTGITPQEAFEKYHNSEVRVAQEAERPIVEKVVNGIMENVQYFREFRKERSEELFEGIVALLGKAQEDGNRIETVVDMGCGQGEILRNIMDYLKEGNSEALGIGIDNKTSVSRDMQDGNMVFMKGDAMETGLADGSIQMINMNYLLQVLSEEMQKQTLEEAKRILAEKGHMVIMDVVQREGKDRRIDKIKHQLLNSFAAYNIRTEEGWEKFLEENGLEIEEKTEVGDRSVAFLVRVKENEKDK